MNKCQCDITRRNYEIKISQCQVLDEGAKGRLVANIAGHLRDAQAFIQERALRNFAKASLLICS